METYSVKEIEDFKIEESANVQKLNEIFRLLNLANHRGAQMNLDSSDLLDLKLTVDRLRKKVQL